MSTRNKSRNKTVQKSSKSTTNHDCLRSSNYFFHIYVHVSNYFPSFIQYAIYHTPQTKFHNGTRLLNSYTCDRTNRWKYVVVDSSYYKFSFTNIWRIICPATFQAVGYTTFKHALHISRKSNQHTDVCNLTIFRITFFGVLTALLYSFQ